MFGVVLEFLVLFFLNILCLGPPFFFYSRLQKGVVKNIPIYRKVASLYLM